MYLQFCKVKENLQKSFDEEAARLKDQRKQLEQAEAEVNGIKINCINFLVLTSKMKICGRD